MRPAWTRSLPSPPVGLSLARESGSALVWDAEPTLGRYDRLGSLALRQRAPAALSLAAISDDGLTVAAGGREGQVWMLTDDLVPLWERKAPSRVVGLAIDHLGQRLAVADGAGGLRVFDRAGKELWHRTAARPLRHLAFVPETGDIFGAADLGLACAYGRDGAPKLRDGVPVHVGGLAVSGDGSVVLLACSTNGLGRYAGPTRETLPGPPASRLVALSYSGRTVLTADMDRGLALRDAGGKARESFELPAPALALALEPLGGAALVVTADGGFLRLEMASPERSAVFAR